MRTLAPRGRYRAALPGTAFLTRSESALTSIVLSSTATSRVTVEPSATAPPPVSAEPAVTVTLELASFALVMPASLTRRASALTSIVLPSTAMSRVTVEPSATAPPPVSAEPAVTVTLEFASFAFVMPASLTRSASVLTSIVLLSTATSRVTDAPSATAPLPPPPLSAGSSELVQLALPARGVACVESREGPRASSR